MAIEEKPLERMTAKELREMALGLPGIQGVHAMKKEELLTAIRAAKGLPEPEKKERQGNAKKVALTSAELKQKIRALRAKREEFLQQRDLRMAEILRKRVSRLKKMTRKAA